ncbi:MAG: exo-alpha-sialidase [Thermoflexaceae bacterium]|nr:exo-alpha-sialidase [Thermoflexaceae bacterium]
MSHVMLLVGTRKGLFIFESRDGRKSWSQRGPFCENWPIMHATWDPKTRAIIAGGGNAWFGPAVWKSTDMGETWTHSSQGLSYPEGEDGTVAVWSLARAGDALYAGVEPAGLFRSLDDGESWSEVAALRAHPTREFWMPGGGGLILHRVLPDAADPSHLMITISAGGAYATEDGGETWEPRNKGVLMSFLPEESQDQPAGQCVHRVVRDAAGTLFQQHHGGLYRSDDDGQHWTSIAEGLPSDFGFAMVAHPHRAGTVFVVPLESDHARYVPGGKAAIWRTKDGGASWEEVRAGFSDEPMFLNVLRGALTADTLDPAGIYFGSATGQLFASTDDGNTWQQIPGLLPVISSVEAAVIEE